MKTFNKCISLEDLETLSDLNKLMIQAFLSEYTAAHQYLMAGHEARGNGYPDVLPEYEEHCEDERKHADEWLLRLEEIGIVLRVDLSQIQTEAPAWTPITTSDIKEQLAILIKAEEDAVAFYKGIVEAARNESDWVTESLAKRHMGDEEKHARDLKRVLESL